MTNNNAFKKLVRERMKETNETFMQAADALMQGKPAVKTVETKKPAQQLKYIDFDTIVTSEYTRNFLLEEIFTLPSPTLIISGDANSGKTSFLASYFRKLAETRKVRLAPFAKRDSEIQGEYSSHYDMYNYMKTLKTVYGETSNLSIQYDDDPIKNMVPSLNRAFTNKIEAFGYDEGKIERNGNLNGLTFQKIDNQRNGFNETLSHEERNFLFATTYYTGYDSKADDVVKTFKNQMERRNTNKETLQEAQVAKTVVAVLHMIKKSKISGPEFSIDFAQI